MNFGRDTRGVSEVIGAILVFGLAIALLAILQTQAIPPANEGVEFNHNNDVQSQLVDFHQAAAETARIGDADSTKLEMGPQYPTRLLFFNPPTPAGTMETSEEGQVTIENVQAEDDTVAKYVNSGPIAVGTRSLSYRANYNEYRSAPRSQYEYGILYNNHDEAQTLVNDGGVIQGREISLLMPAGELHESSTRAMSIDPRPVSAPAKTVSITGDGSGNPVTLTLPSEMDASLWQDAIDTTHVESIVPNGDGTITIELDPSETYALRMARIGVGDATSEQTPEYLFSQRGTQFDIPQGQSRGLDIEIRDEYNNPVAHEDVQVRIADGGGTIDTEATSGADGVARPRFQAPTTPQRVTVDVTLRDSFDDGFQPDSDPRDLQLDVWVRSYQGGFGNDPSITIHDIQSGCGSAGIADYLDDPFNSLLGDDPGTVSVDWQVTLNGDQTDLDTVDLRMINEANGRVVDTVVYAYEEEGADSQSPREQTGLIDETGTCTDSYKIRVLARSTGSASDMETRDGLTT